jgi:hypothetical protein
LFEEIRTEFLLKIVAFSFEQSIKFS